MRAQATPPLRLHGYFPGAIGRITELHAVYYHEHWGFDISFEAQVGRELSMFMSNFVTGRDGLWTVFCGEQFAGSIAIDGSLGSTEGARLRWFIIEPIFQGRGIGRELIQAAIELCRQAGHRKVFLWTFKGLEAARKLYEEAGFRLTEESEVDQWGADIAEQRFDLEFGNSE